jgi:hypothetical protein
MERKPFLLRIDPELWADLEQWAQAELRSVNGQIEYLLRQAMQKRRGGDTPGMAVRKSPRATDTRKTK